MEEYPELVRADVLTILMDGKRLLDLEGRHNAQSSVQMIIQGLADSRDTSRQALSVVLTKFDDIQAARDGKRAQDDFESFVERIRSLYGSSFSDVSSFRVAASPTTTILPRGYGVPDLLRYWVRQQRSVPSAQPWSGIPSRAIGRITQLAD